MKRAIVIYLEDKPSLMKQFGLLYTSFKYIQSKDTDLVVFGTKRALKKVPADCIKVEYRPISYGREWKKYHYINSISCLTNERAAFLEDYDLLLRTDVDTFLTPAWNDFYPKFYTVGKGAYVHNNDVMVRLKKIAQSIGLNHRGIHNIGSTHYGNASLIRDVCRLSVSTAKYILDNEFNNGAGQWPGWWVGVTSMYSSEIAVNHLVNRMIVDNQKLDYFSSSADPIKEHPHIHCWPGDEIFSKVNFEKGLYNHFSMDDLDCTIVKDYCLYIALKSQLEMPWIFR